MCRSRGLLCSHRTAYHLSHRPCLGNLSAAMTRTSQCQSLNETGSHLTNCTSPRLPLSEKSKRGESIQGLDICNNAILFSPLLATPLYIFSGDRVSKQRNESLHTLRFQQRYQLTLYYPYRTRALTIIKASWSPVDAYG
jgi:hypothetical protein